MQDRVRQAQVLEAVTPKAALQPMSVRSSDQQQLLGRVYECMHEVREGTSISPQNTCMV